MSYQPHYIASFEEESGLNTYYEPFIIPEKAFVDMQDAYCFRGRVIRRPGYKLLGRLRRVLTAQSMGNIVEASVGPYPHQETFNIFTGLAIPGMAEPNAQIQPGSATASLTITIGAPISQTLVDVTGDGSTWTISSGLITAASLNYNTGNLLLTFSAAAGSSAATITGGYCPGFPVMGLETEDLTAINAKNLIAFDQKYAYTFDNATKQFKELPASTPTTWNGNNSDFFWSTNYFSNSNGKLFWATNSNMTGSTRDPIRYYDTHDWIPFYPTLDTTPNKLYNSLIILPYKGRLIFMHTWEGTTLNGTVEKPQRIRWSQVGDPTDQTNAYLTTTIGRGGYIDVATSEAIIGAEFIKDTLIIKFERSSWKLVYTGNETQPFIVQKINTSLGSIARFSLVPFDRGVYTISNYGVTTDDSVNVERIDLQIPNQIFGFNNLADLPKRVHGIRDFYNELVYWTYPDAKDNLTYPNKVLLYNYRNNTYSVFNDSFTCYGYYQNASNKTWAELSDLTWADWNTPWNSALLTALFPSVVAGTQHGFVEIVTQKVSNDASLYIDSIDFSTTPVNFVIPDHNLKINDIIVIYGIAGSGSPNPSSLNFNAYKVSSIIDDDTVNLLFFHATVEQFVDPSTFGMIGPGSNYLGGGTIAKLNGFLLQTKRFAPFYEAGSQCRVGMIDFLFDKTTNGEITSDIFVDEDSSTSMTDESVNTSLQGSNIVRTRPENLNLYPFQSKQDKIWHRQIIESIAQNFQIQLSMSDIQLANFETSEADVQLHALAIYLSKNARLTQ